MTDEQKKYEKPVKGGYVIDASNKKLEIYSNPNETHGVLFEDILSISIKKDSYTENKHEFTTMSNIGFGDRFYCIIIWSFYILKSNFNRIGIRCCWICDGWSLHEN